MTSGPTIQRCPHDKENPYAIISRDLIRDETISPMCRWLLLYLLSMADGWKISIAHIIQHVKPFVGKNKVYAIVNEAIEAGYMMREEWFITPENKTGGAKGSFKRIRYYLSETPKFKKCLPRPGFRDPHDRDAHGGTLRITKEEVAIKEALSVEDAGAPPVKAAKETQAETETPVTKASPEPKPKLTPKKVAPEAKKVPPKAKEVVPEANVVPPTPLEPQEMPLEARILTREGIHTTVPQNELYRRLVNAGCNFPPDAIRYAWKTLCEYTGVVHDWWRFVEGTAQNYERHKKSERIGAAECRKKQLEGVKTGKGAKNSCKDSISESDSSVQACPNSFTLEDIQAAQKRMEKLLEEQDRIVREKNRLYYSNPTKQDSSS